MTSKKAFHTLPPKPGMDAEFGPALLKGKKMRWLTKKQVQAAAKISEIDAIQCSILHWHQLSTCTQKELDNKLTEELICGDYCALCQRHELGEYCPFQNRKCDGCTHTWKIAAYKFIDYKSSRKADDFKLFQKAAGKVEQALQKVLKRYQSK